MFRPDVLAGRVVAVAGPTGPAMEAVAGAIASAGAALVLCGDADALDELAWDLSERTDAPVDVVAWDGADPGAGLARSLRQPEWRSCALVLLGGDGWSAEAATAWSGRGGAVVVNQGGAVAEPAGAAVIEADTAVALDLLSSWVVFLLSPSGRAARAPVVVALG